MVHERSSLQNISEGTMVKPNYRQRYLIRLENKKLKYSSKQILEVSAKLSRSVDSLVEIKNVRISNNSIEFDLFCDEVTSKKKALDDLTQNFGDLLTERNLREEFPSSSKEETIAIALQLFNDERYWECHETLEQVWRPEPAGKEKDVLQGIILAASALVHSQKNEDTVCIGMIPRALSKLGSWDSERYYSFNISKLEDSLEKIEQSGKIEFPKL